MSADDMLLGETDGVDEKPPFPMVNTFFGLKRRAVGRGDGEGRAALQRLHGRTAHHDRCSGRDRRHAATAGRARYLTRFDAAFRLLWTARIV